MNWKKLGLIFSADNNSSLMHSYARVPIVDHINGSLYYIYFASRDLTNRERIFRLVFDIEKMRVLDLDLNPVLDYGENIGAFDDNGVTPCCILNHGTRKLMYYCGWNIHVKIPFTCAIGVAESFDGGVTFKKLFMGAVLDRDRYDSQFVAVNDVMFDDGVFRTWYLSCLKWEAMPSGKLLHFYNIKQAHSVNGVDWIKSDQRCIDFKNDYEYAISTPRVIKDSKCDYKMWYSFRAQKNIESYRIGYAESIDGNTWTRMDERMSSFEPALSGWDSEMVCYPYILDYEGSRFMFYNGNGYGRTGFGLALMEDMS